MIPNLGGVILKYRAPIAALLLAISVFMAFGAMRLKIATSFVNFFPAHHPNMLLYREFREPFGGAQRLVIMLGVRKGDIFNPSTLNKIYEINTAMHRLPGVEHQSVRSLASYRVTYVEPSPGALESHAYMYPVPPANLKGIEHLKRLVVEHQESLRSIVSADLKSTTISAAFNERYLDYRSVFNQVRNLVKRYSDDNTRIYVAGEPMVRGYGYYYLPRILIILAISILGMFLIIYLALGKRSTWWAPIITGSLSALWGCGFVGWAGYEFDPVMLVIPLILTARDMSHGIQWQGRYYDELDRSPDKLTACINTTNLMLPPGSLSIAADIAGIIFVAFGGIPVLKDIGFGGSVWLASSLTMVFIFQPILMSYIPTPKIRRAPTRVSVRANYLRDITGRLVNLPTTPGILRGMLLVFAAAILLWGIIAGLHANVGYSAPGTPLYAEDSKINRDIATISSKFAVDEGWVVIRTPRWPSDQCVLAPHVVKMVDDLRDSLLTDPKVVAVSSYASSILTVFNEMFHNGYPKHFAVPRNLALAGQLFHLYEGGTAPGESDYYIPDPTTDTTAGVHILLRDHEYGTLNDLLARLKAFKRSHIEGDPSLSQVRFDYLGGIAGLYAAANDVLFQLDLFNITFVLAVIFLFSALSFRSLIAGGLFVLSCVLANFAAFIYMAVRGIGLTIDTIPVISLGIGLGIDYGFYTVSRIRDEVILGESLSTAITIALENTGAAVLTTFLTMVGGIVPWVFSPVLFHNEMSLLLIFLMCTNMIAGVLILPTFIAWARPSFICAYEKHEEATIGPAARATRRP